MLIFFFKKSCIFSFFPWWVLSAESGNGKKLWFASYPPRMIWRLTNIYDITKNYFENGHFLPRFLDYVALLTGPWTICACSGCTRWLSRALYPPGDEISPGKASYFVYRSLLSNVPCDCALAIQFQWPYLPCWALAAGAASSELEWSMWASLPSCGGVWQHIPPNNVMSEKGKKHKFLSLYWTFWSVLSVAVCISRSRWNKSPAGEAQ